MEILESDDYTKYMVSAREGSKMFYASCDDEVTLTDVRCSCQKFECQGLPCCHIMVVLIKLGIMMPQCCVLNRWTRNAKSSSAVDESDPVNAVKRARVAELVDLAKIVFEDASSDEIVRWKELLVSDRNNKKRKIDDLVEKSSPTREATPINVLNPEEVMSKGASKKMKSFLHSKEYRE
ncbi:hypothetical protein PR202_ga15687 [Eleusine coracana subsp. coracana]|uniref:Protein FAR1-RELATED SEQUENCE n=1 Tax=Eleusine coracana subsp. coracana TaxID=191504 RepID=A0AAV5CK43_ELECO|nr:hypothetical protein PR202_ga15687 [Eleusine coracana subsp. coracana]